MIAAISSLPLHSISMKDVIFLLLHLLTTIAKLIQPGCSRAAIAENLLLKQQLLIHSRSRQRAPNLTTKDRTLLGPYHSCSIHDGWSDQLSSSSHPPYSISITR